MKSMIGNQKGITFIGICIILAVIAAFVLTTLRLFPLYNEKAIVISAMKSITQRPGIEDASSNDVLKQFMRTVQVGGSNRFDDRSIKKLASVDKEGKERFLTVQFEARNKYFDDIEFVLVFNESYKLGGGK